MKRELAGTEVRCWDCRQMVLVPKADVPHLALHAIGAAIRDAFAPQWVVSIVVMALAVTGALLVSDVGVRLEVLAMIAVAAGYGFLVWLSSEGAKDAAVDDERAAARPSPWRIGAQAALVLAFGLVLSVPWLSAPPTRDAYPVPIRITGIGLLGFVVVALAFPPAMLLAFGRDEQGPLTSRRLLAIVRGQPKVTALTLAIFPLAMVGTELALFVLTSIAGWLPYFLLDLFPDPEPICESLGMPVKFIVNAPSWASPRYLRMYGIRLTQGYTLIGALPPSLSVTRVLRSYPWHWSVSNKEYYYWRAILTLPIALVPPLFLSVQARMLATLARLERMSKTV